METSSSGAVGPVEFRGPGGLLVRGLRFGSGERWVVLVHDEGNDLDSWRPLAFELAKHGYTALAFDLPGHGASDDPWEVSQAPAAVVAAIDFAGSPQVYVACAGTGAPAALAASIERKVLAAALLSPRSDDRVASLDRWREARLPKLILAGTLDPVAASLAEVFYRSAIGPCEMMQLPVPEQGTYLLSGEWGQHVIEGILAHLRRHQ